MKSVLWPEIVVPGALPGLELAVVIQRAQRKEVAAISEIYARYATSILRFLYARVNERELAQDLTQEVFIRVIKNIGGFEYRDEKSFLAWLYAIAANMLTSYYRRHGNPATPLEHQDGFLHTQNTDAVGQVHDRLALEEAMRQLTAEQQRILSLRFFADMSNSEIARVLNRSEGSIKAIQYRALQSLQRILERERERLPHVQTES
jgi:RNA polymerase sigma-70 factor, ECF subfamily